MTTLAVTVYLNHGPDRFFGFSRDDAQLRQAAQFDLTLADHLSGHHLADGALEVIFEQLNIDVPEHPWAIAYRQAGHRSFSVGDVAVVAETAFACGMVGWTRISTDDLAAALAR
ncbi:MAG: hypothetical protein JOZ49_22895 [Mycolicibacterium sp.]|nr:hypothetical protein [Mycolicibacterium sp.]